jgi:hypothetical protein
MARNKGRLGIVIVTVLVVGLFVIGSQVGAYEPPPPGDHYQGPARVGTFTFSEPTEPTGCPEGWSSCVAVRFTGQIGSETLTGFGPALCPADFQEITQDNLEAGLINCTDWLYEFAPKNVYVDGVKVMNVRSFVHDGETITADLVAVWAVIK